MTRVIVPFHLKWSQQQIIAAGLRQQARGLPVRLIILKARRVGGSSLTEGLELLHGMAEEAALGLIVAHLFKSTKGLFEVPINLIDEALPGRRSLHQLCNIWHTKHQIGIPKASGSGSLIDLATAGSVSGAGGRALSFTFLHLSEAAYFPGIQPFTSLLPTVPFHPSTFVVIESTANGRVGPGAAFYDYWQKACEGRNDYEPVFLPWHRDPTYIRPESQAADAPADEYEEWLMREFHCNKSQIAWYRATLTTECKGTPAIMQQEYPSSPEEAFTASGDPAFEHDELEYARSTIADPIAVGDFKCQRGEEATFEPYASGDWAIWSWPVEGYHYFIGCDAARGMQLEEGEVEPSPEGDFASNVIWCAETGEQAARLAKRIPPEVLADRLNAAGRFYNRAMINIELTGNLGMWAQSVLRDRHRYPLLFRWRGSKDDRIQDQNRFAKRTVLGFETGVRSRELIFDAFRAALRERRVIVHDRILLSQMENATRQEGFRWEVVRGHDDILIAALIGWIAREQWGPNPLNSLAGSSRQTLPGVRPSESEGYNPATWQDDASMALIRHREMIDRYNVKRRQQDPLAGS